ncbi:hypothetical protein HS088_TW13G00742 [Tripterygium wilfordii]|uniref:Protein GAMETE EXPRESSED 3 n=1 Tax=Tripterygium wilfordii TaxID=458696 RepID=A0A7J7CUV4_TRIWF|nr:hypothetical protein HS088_TW13G00742 [Tripterygium wilfordii]
MIPPAYTQSQIYAAHPPSFSVPRLSKPLIGEDERIYACSDRNFYAFESNGSIVWVLHLNYQCNVGMAPVNGGKGKIYLVAENKVLKISFSDTATSPATADVFFGHEAAGEIIGISVSTLSSTVFISIKNRGLFAYTMRGDLLWSVGPVLSQFGYRQGCRKGITDCYFNSAPVIDQCEASIYISNSAGELYSLSMHSPHFKWILDISPFHKNFTITPGNNGRLYVTVPIRTLILAVDVSTGNILWEGNIGPLSSEGCSPLIDSNGRWISVGSLDGFLYSFSPTGVLKKFQKAAAEDSVVQVSPLLDCSGYGVYMSQTQMEGKISHTIGEYSFFSAMKPESVVFSLLVPATGSIHWSENYPGPISSLLSKSDLRHFMLDETIILAFITASSKILSETNALRFHGESRLLSFAGNERAILWFLFFESAVLVVFAALVRFCCIFWRKKKLQGQNLSTFLEKRRSLQLRKKMFNRTITELERKASEEAVANDVIHDLGDLVQQRERIERKLSTTYSLGRDEAGSSSKFLIPLYDGLTRSYSFQNAKKESVTVFHTLSEPSSGENGSETESDDSNFQEDILLSAKAKARIEAESSSSDQHFEKDYERNRSMEVSSSKGHVNPLFMEHILTREKLHDEGEATESIPSSSRSAWLKRRSTSLTK